MGEAVSRLGCLGGSWEALRSLVATDTSTIAVLGLRPDVCAIEHGGYVRWVLIALALFIEDGLVAGQQGRR